MVDEVIRPSELYERTGIQKQVFNTIYQLTVLKREYPEWLAAADGFLMIPEYVNFLLRPAAHIVGGGSPPPNTWWCFPAEWESFRG